MSSSSQSRPRPLRALISRLRLAVRDFLTTYGVILFTAILAGATFALVVTSIYQHFDAIAAGKLMEKQLDAMNKSAEIQWSILHTLNRPYVLFESPIKFNKGNSAWTFGISIGNIGKTPTRNLVYDGACSFFSNDYFTFFENKGHTLSRSAELGPGGTNLFQPYFNCVVNKTDKEQMDQLNTLKELDKPFFVFGWTKYKDSLGGDNQYETKFCRVYLHILMDGADFDSCNKQYNCLDDGCASH